MNIPVGAVPKERVRCVFWPINLVVGGSSGAFLTLNGTGVLVLVFVIDLRAKNHQVAHG